MKRLLQRAGLLGLLLVVVPALALAISIENTQSGTISCVTVTHQAAATKVISAIGSGSRRVKWSIWTTSGAGTIVFAEQVAAPGGQGATTGNLLGGMTFTDDGPATYAGNVWVYVPGGTDVWVCTMTNP